jgi:hypothetical protein
LQVFSVASGYRNSSSNTILNFSKMSSDSLQNASSNERRKARSKSLSYGAPPIDSNDNNNNAAADSSGSDPSYQTHKFDEFGRLIGSHASQQSIEAGTATVLIFGFFFFVINKKYHIPFTYQI